MAVVDIILCLQPFVTFVFIGVCSELFDKLLSAVGRSVNA